MLSLLFPHHLIYSSLGFKYDVDDYILQMANAFIGAGRSGPCIGSRRVELYSFLQHTKSFGVFADTLHVVVMFCVLLESIHCCI